MFTFTGISHRIKAQEGAMCVSVCVLLLILLSGRRLEAKLFLLGVDALADPIHALLEDYLRDRNGEKKRRMKGKKEEKRSAGTLT